MGRAFKFLVGASALSIGAVSGGAAAAQDADTADQAKDIVVTGSRIQGDKVTVTGPISTISGDDLRSSGNSTIDQTLNQLPEIKAQGGATAGNSNAAGIYSVDVRGLGAARTLVLVNGRRFMPANEDMLVDLATIPEALVKRVDVVTGGASAAYGSDAVGGVVNFILDDKFEGVRANYDFGITQRGDGVSHKASLTLGGNFAGDRGNLVGSLSYLRQDGIQATDRSFSRAALKTQDGKLVEGGAQQIPGSLIPLSSSQLAKVSGVDVSGTGCSGKVQGLRFDETGAAVAFCNPTDLYNSANDQVLIRPQNLYQGSLLGHYDIASNVHLYVEGYFVRNENHYALAPYASTIQDGTSGKLTINDAVNNPALLSATRAFLGNNAALFDPDGDGNYTFSGVLSRLTDVGARTYDYIRTSVEGTMGLKGDIALGDGKWSWDGYYSYQALYGHMAAHGVVSQTRLAQALDAVTDPDTGEAVCSNQTGGCVPVTIFGVGAISSEAAAYIAPVATSDTDVTRNMAAFGISGPLLRLPAGSIQAAFGVEYRREGFDFTPDAQVASGQLSANVPQQASSHSMHVSEQYGEFDVPILKEKPFFHDLSLNAAFRFSQYSTIGSVFAWKGGAQWGPTSWIQLRGAYQRAVRAPTLSTLYGQMTSGANAFTDPCNASLNPSPAVKALCTAQGVPSDDIDTFTQIGSNTNVTGGGNADLKEEKSDTLTFGAALKPAFLPRLNLSVDYYDIKVLNAISTINANQTATLCFQSLDADNPFCQRMVRLSSGAIGTIFTTQVNVASRQVRGLDIQASYRFPLPGILELGGDAASLDLRFYANRQFSDKSIAYAGATAIECSGKFGGTCTGAGTWPSLSFKAQLAATYESGPVSLALRSRYVGGLDVYEGISAWRDHVPGYVYFDLNGQFRLPAGLTFSLGINNLFDTQPPVFGQDLAGPVNVPEATYDLLGRRYNMGLQMKF